MNVRNRRISIGFQGGQQLALRVSDEQWSLLQGALGNPGWHDLVSDEGPVKLDVSQVVYVRIEGDESRVGFGA
jgi:hypothetical protein